ncbi:MAG: YfiM family protein [Bacteroidales bacterium]|nr:YfiM family protein [Bacteroidales bacterium]
MTLRTIITWFFIVSSAIGYSQTQPYFVKKYPDSLHKKRLTFVIGGQSLVYATSLAILYKGWYADYPQSNFHWFDDNSEWLQMDKIGHATTSAYFGKFGYEMYRNAGVERKKAIWIGGSAGFVFLMVVETLDGFSSQWGASAGDYAANAFGAGLFISQQLGWDEQRLNLKWSYHPTEFAKYRPDQLGRGFMESMLKDYNGQTYWLSGNIKSFLPKQSKFPGWLNVSLGYSGEGMLGANSNPKYFEGATMPEYTRYRQYYLSLDVDLPRIKTRSHFLKFILNGLNFIKIPFPTLEYNNQDGLKFHPLFF